MRQSYWKPQHEVFIRCMLKHEDPTQAYQTAYPKTRPASARVGGHRLYNYAHIRQRIEPLLRERRAEAHKKALEDGAERERLQNERRLEIRRMLYKVVMRKLKRKRNFTIKGQIITVEDNPSINIVLNAMVLDLRLEAGYDNWPVIEARFARIMASLLPREKRVQSVMNSRANAIQAIIPSNRPRATLLQKQTRKLPSLVKEGPLTNSLANLSTAVVEKLRTNNQAQERNVAVQKRVQTVTISSTNAAQTHRVHDVKTARITRAVTKTIWPVIKETG